LHLIYQHADGIRNSQGKIYRGADTRGSDGYFVYWFAAGFGCLDHIPPQPWPAWALIELTRKTEPEHIVVADHKAKAPIGGAIDAIKRTLENAPAGNRNAILYWCAHRLRERGISHAKAEELLLPVVPEPNHPKKDRGTVASAYRGRTAA
jgi:hypothetical protein